MTDDNKSNEVGAPVLSFGGVKAQEPSSQRRRLSTMLWGKPGCGKTTLASTFPGKKLWINLDPDGTASLQDCDDVHEFDLSEQSSTSVCTKLCTDNVGGLERILAQSGADTLVIDSLTTLSDMLLEYVVGKVKNATIETPGMHGYTMRSGLLSRFIKNVLTITGKLGVHCVFIAHEDAGSTNDDGHVIDYPIMLPGKQKEVATLYISEVWAVRDAGRDRRIAIRPCGLRRSMKTRMFDTSGSPEFVWNYDPVKRSGQKVSDWYKQWEESGFRKIPLPK